jgi:hypothetical protein
MSNLDRQCHWENVYHAKNVSTLAGYFVASVNSRRGRGSAKPPLSGISGKL